MSLQSAPVRAAAWIPVAGPGPNDIQLELSTLSLPNDLCCHVCLDVEYRKSESGYSKIIGPKTALCQYSHRLKKCP